MKSHTVDQQLEILSQKTEYGDLQTGQMMARQLWERLAEGRPLRVYLGVDPTAPDLHLGHAVVLMKLAQFQRLGHHCTLLIGDFTALIGDPSDKDKTRPQLSPAQIEANVKTYIAQANQLLDPAQTTIRYNSEWHSKLTFADLIQLASPFTVAQFLARDNFAKRHAKGEPIHLHEFFYALMQGYDAVAMEADVQLGGTDQTFNILAGRRLQQTMGQKPQVMLTNPMLPGTDGRVKMSKSLGNAIPITTPPADMYGQLMSLPDEAMRPYFELLTPLPAAEIGQIFTALETGQAHPRDIKMRLARMVTAIFHGEVSANQAEKAFITVFQERKLPANIPDHKISHPINIVDLMVGLGLAKSKSAARRLIQQGGVRLNDNKIDDIDLALKPKPDKRILRVGKRHFVELK